MAAGGLWAVVASVAIADQCTKALALRLLVGGDRRTMLRSVGFRLVRNRHGANPTLPVRFTIAASVLLSAVVLSVADHVGFGARVALGLALGGATGNVLDRLRHGAVIDFIAIGRWPAFNLADAALTVGAMLAVWSWR